jgi:hypothetical protein
MRGGPDEDSPEHAAPAARKRKSAAAIAALLN